MRPFLALSAGSLALAGCGWLIGGDWDGTARGSADDGGGGEASTVGSSGGPADGGSGADGANDSAGQADGGRGPKPAQRLVPAGVFTYATTYGSATARITHDFYVDVDEVTVDQFREWVSAGKPPPTCGGTGACPLEPNGPYAGTMTWDPSANGNVATDDQKACESDPAKIGPTAALGNDRLPLNCVSWYQAVALCHFRGARLLTEVEWYYVAIRGAGVYPWGSSPAKDCTQSTFGFVADGGAPANGCGFPVPVENAPGDLSQDQLHDLGGSLAEHVWASPVLDFKGPPDPLPDDWTGPATSAYQRVARGGHFMSSASDLGAPAGPIAPFFDRPYANVGLRCARTKL